MVYNQEYILLHYIYVMSGGQKAENVCVLIYRSICALPVLIDKINKYQTFGSNILITLMPNMQLYNELT